MKSKLFLSTLLSLLICLSVHSQEKILDTHLHLYDTEREGSFDFLDDHASSGSDILRYPHLADTFLDTAGPAGVSYGYVVEASLRRKDNFWLSLITDTSDCLLGFSANLDPRATTYRSDLDSLMHNPKFRGIRPRVGGLNLGDVSVQKQFVELARRNLILELWGNSANIATIAHMYPNMNIIVNHFGGGSAPDGNVAPSNYSAIMAVLAAEPNVYLKISALYTLSGKQPAPTDMEYYKPLIDAAVDAFGPERVLYGSNWSLSDLRGPYAGVVELLQAYCDQRENLSREQLLYDNAMKAYGLMNNEVKHPGTGNGLFVSYWNGEAGGRGWWTDSIHGTFVPELNTYWDGRPATGVNGDFWNARFQGELEPMFSGTHRFYFTINDYAKLWMDGELVFDGWGGAYSGLCHTFDLNLSEGQKISIQLDYANTQGDGFARLEWESDAFAREVIPQNQFYSNVDTTSHVGMGIPESDLREIRIYPNPATDHICISCPEQTLCEAYTLTGRKLDVFTIDAELTQRDSSDWPSGMYILQFRTRNRSSYRKVLVKQKN